MKENAGQKSKASWFRRTLLLLLRISLAITVVIYLISSAPRAWRWAEMQWVRKDGIARLHDVVTAALAQNDPLRAQKWLMYRPQQDTGVILRALPDFASELPAAVFFDVARRMKRMGNKEEYLFWTLYARYRLRYDLLRCGSPESVRIFSKLQNIMMKAEDPAMEKALSEIPTLVPLLRRVMDYDAHHPAHNDPAGVCEAVHKLERGNYKTVDETQWAPIRHTLRNVTERSLKDMSADDNDLNKFRK